ncbi:FecR family protein [Methylorubrum extorquens]
MASPQRFEDARAEAAIEWMVEISSGEASADQLEAFEAWLRADTANETAWIRLQEGLMPCGVTARRGAGQAVLKRHLGAHRENRRNVILGLACLAGLGVVSAGIADRYIPLSEILADRVTYTGGQETVALSDGSELVLAPRTALNIVSEPGQRGIQLLTGEVLMRVAPDATPFKVQTGALTLVTSAGTFLVESRDERLAVTGIEGTGRLAYASAAESLAAGDLIEFASGNRRRLKADIAAATAWLDGLLVAKDSSLHAIATKLQRYFTGIIQVEPGVADLRVTGVFSLRDPEATLDALAESLGLSQARLSRYWIKLGPAKV